MKRAGRPHSVQHRTLWESSSVTISEQCAGNIATGPVYTQLQDTCFPEFTAACSTEETDLTDRRGGEREQMDVSCPCVWGFVFPHGYAAYSVHVQYTHTHTHTHTHPHKFRAWMGMINPNYDGNFLGEVIVQQQDSWSTSELPAENLNVLIMLNMCSGELLHCGRFVERCWSEQRYNTTNNNTNKTHINHYSGQSVFCSCLQTVCVWFWSGRVGVHFM